MKNNDSTNINVRVSFYIIEKTVSLYNSQKRASLCHKRKLPGSDKIQKHNKKKRYRTKRYTQKKVSNVTSGRKFLFCCWILDSGAWRSPASPTPSLPLWGPNRAPDQDFRKTLYTGQLPAAVVLANGSAVFCRIENKTIINDTVDKARLYWVANTFSRESRIWFPVFERRFLRR